MRIDRDRPYCYLDGGVLRDELENPKLLDALLDALQVPGKPVTLRSPPPSCSADSTGAICTRKSWPARVVVTKFATGCILLRLRRCSIVSSACAMSGRSTGP